VKRLFSENVDLAQMAKTKIIFGKKKSRFGEKKAFLVIKKIGVVCCVCVIVERDDTKSSVVNCCILYVGYGCAQTNKRNSFTICCHSVLYFLHIVHKQSIVVP
jgi:hypothetical protein